jgi:hypothetical protein
MSKSDALESGLLALIFNATAIANLAQNNATAPLTNLWVSLHTADPGDAGTAVTSEAAYTNYARVAVARTTGGWTVSGTAPTQVVPVAAITFPASGAAGTTITHFGIVSTASGAGVLYYSGTVTPNIAIGASGITPQLTTATAITED